MPTKSRIKVQLPPSLAAAKKSTTRPPAGASIPKMPAKPKGPMRIPTPEGGFIKKPSIQKMEPPVRRTTQVLGYLKDKLETVTNGEYSEADKAKVEKAVRVEEDRVRQSNEDYLLALGRMEAKKQAAEEELRAYKAAKRALSARRLAEG